MILQHDRQCNHFGMCGCSQSVGRRLQAVLQQKVLRCALGKYLLIAGVLLNSVLLIINRFVKRLPNGVQIPLLLVGIGLILFGFLITKK